MSAAQPDATARLRWGVYGVLIAVGIGAMLGRILAVDSVDRIALEEQRLKALPEELQHRRDELKKQGLDAKTIDGKMARIEADLRAKAEIRRPFLSANDRSRWCTLRALVEPEMRVPGAPYAIDKVIQQPNWDTIDMVKHGGGDEPPDAAAAKYEPGQRVPNWDGQQVGGHLYSSKPPLLPTILAGEYWLLTKLTGATLGTQPYFLGRIMLISINVLPMLIYFWLLARLVERLGTTDWGRVFAMAAGVFATFLTTFAVVLNNHLPAAVCAIVALYAGVCVWFDGQRQWRYFAIAGFFGALMVANELPAAALFAALGLALLWKAPRPTLLAGVPAAVLVGVAFFGTNWLAHGRLTPAYGHRTLKAEGSPAAQGEAWYDYTYIRNGRVYDSYWNNPVGVDRGEPSWAMYAFHVIVGHHGMFTLTPIWLLTAAGLAIWLWRGQPRPQRELAAMIAAVSIVCIAFYLAQPQVNRNYGGVAGGLRWLFWFAPLWLVGLLPAADALGRRAWTRWLALVLLAISVLSVSYPTWNPWTQPWLMNYLAYWGWQP